jgi:hypothetical protein
MPDLSTALLVGTVDDDELALVLSGHYGRAVGDYPSVHYSKDDRGPAVTMVYANKRIVSVSTGSRWDADDLPLLRERLTESVFSGEVRIGRCVLMSAQPLHGYVELGSAGRLLPVPAHAPRPMHPIGNCEPLLHEVSYTSSPDFRIDELRRQRVALNTRTILNVLINGGVTQLPATGTQRWVMQSDSMHAQHEREVYAYDGFSPSSETFSSIDGLGEPQRVPDAEYLGRIGCLPGEPLALPTSFNRWLAAYDGLQRDDQERFLRAAYWFDHAGTARGSSYSAALIALVTAIECLMPRPDGRVFCRDCKQEKGDGPTKRFMAFVTSHAPGGNGAERYVRDLYRTRSTLSHGWQLFLRDRDAAMWPLHPAKSEEYFRTDGATALARRILLSWLDSLQPRASHPTNR